MGNTLGVINQHYKTPAKRGMKVRCGSRHGVITAACRSNMYINVRWDRIPHSMPIHPFDLDYLVDEQWQIGQEMCDKFNARIDKWFGQPEAK